MNSFELNKIAGAVLFSCLCLLALNIAAGAVYAPRKPAKPGYEIEVPVEAAAEPGAGGGAEPQQPIEQLLASADPKKGEAAAKACGACHTFEKGGANKVGPNLWGVVGRAKHTEAGFKYSSGMMGQAGEWSVDELNTFLTNPKAKVPGTAMSYAGIARGGQRADVIAYLNSLADSPKPLPTAPAPAADKK